MKLSTRVRYGVRAMTELAKNSDTRLVPLHEIAENQSISNKYLEHMIASLKNAGLVKSVRGAEGGYRLARPASEITIWDIYEVLDLASDLISCTNNCDSRDETCPRLNCCGARHIWTQLGQEVEKVLRSWTLEDLVEKENVFDDDISKEAS